MESTDTFAGAHFSPPLDAAKKVFESLVYTHKGLVPLLAHFQANL